MSSDEDMDRCSLMEAMIAGLEQAARSAHAHVETMRAGRRESLTWPDGSDRIWVHTALRRAVDRAAAADRDVEQVRAMFTQSARCDS